MSKSILHFTHCTVTVPQLFVLIQLLNKYFLPAQGCLALTNLSPTYTSPLFPCCSQVAQGYVKRNVIISKCRDCWKFEVSQTGFNMNIWTTISLSEERRHMDNHFYSWTLDQLLLSVDMWTIIKLLYLNVHGQFYRQQPLFIDTM